MRGHRSAGGAPRRGRRRRLAACSLLFLTVPALGEIATDGSVGPLRSLSGSMVIGQDLGTRAGDNLFHSFQTFNIRTGESATFTGDPDIANVVGRVTGGSASAIDGLLRSQVGKANVFLVNPKGIVFGPNARVDVPAAFHASTADRVVFPDGTYYSATDRAGSTLSVASPEAFGFLAHQTPGTIEVDGSRLDAFRPGSTVSLVGGNATVTIDRTTSSFARIASEGGDIRVIAVGSPAQAGQVSIRDGSTTLAPGGRVEASWGSKIDVSGAAGPSAILLRGGTIEVLSDAWIGAWRTGSEDSAGVVRLAADDIAVTDSMIDARVTAGGRGSDIAIEGGHSILLSGATIVTTAFSALPANGGDIAIDAPNAAVTLGNGAYFQSGTTGLGRSGDIRIAARGLDVGGNSALVSVSTGAGRAGDVELSVGNSMTVAGGSYIRSRSSGTGAAGSIGIEAGGSLGLDQGSFLDSSTSGAGAGGAIGVKIGGSMTLVGGSYLWSRSISTGAAGSIGIDAGGSLGLDQGSFLDSSTSGAGAGGAIGVKIGGSMTLAGGSYLRSRSSGSGAAGDIGIDVDGSLALNRGNIYSYSIGTGAAGDLRIAVDGSMTLDYGFLDSSATGGGAAGDQTIAVGGSLKLPRGSFDSSTSGAGPGGDIRLQTGGSMTLGGGSYIRSRSSGTGAAGDLAITVGGSLDLSLGSLDSSTSGAGSGGDISLEIGNSMTVDRSYIRSRSTWTGAAGDLAITVGGSLALNNGALESYSSGSGSAGDLKIDTGGSLLLSQSFLYSYTTSANPGGAIDVRVGGSLTATGGSEMVAFTSGSGAAGAVSVETGDSVSLDDAWLGAWTYGSGDAGTVRVAAGNRIVIRNGAGLLAHTLGAGRAGGVALTAAGDIELTDSNVHADSVGTGLGKRFGDAGRVEIRAGSLAMTDSSLRVTSFNRANAGVIDISVSGDILVDTTADETAGFWAGNRLGLDEPPFDPALVASEGRSGEILLNARNIVLHNGSAIDIGTAGGDGGKVVIDAGSLYLLDGAAIQAGPIGTGKGGEIRIALDDTLWIEGLRPGILTPASISTMSADLAEALGYGARPIGPSGAIDISAQRVIVGRDGEINAASASASPAGDLTLRVGTLEVLDGGTIRSTALSTGAAGDILIDATQGVAVRGYGLFASEISASSNNLSQPGQGSGGDVRITAPELLVDLGGEIASRTGSSGAAGTIALTVDRLTLRRGGKIDTSTVSDLVPGVAGAAGTIEIHANTIALDGSGAELVPFLWRTTGILSSSTGGGDAGTIRVFAAANIDIVQGARILASASAAGDGGDIEIAAGALTVDNALVSSRANRGASGFAGNVTIATNRLDLRNGAQISVSAGQRVPAARLAAAPPSRIGISANGIALDSGSAIDAESTGNVAAGSISIAAATLRLAGQSRITTESLQADGGPIDLSAGRLDLVDSQIVTSVLGPAGDGGDIRIRTDVLAMNGGFIQANTAAAGAAGGAISISAGTVLLNNGFVQVGGNERLTFRPGTGLNVIQAAAPLGVEGSVETTLPDLDATRGLADLATPVADPEGLVRERCLTGARGAGSSLVEQPVAGLPAGPADPAAVSFGGARLDRLLAGQ